LEDEEEGSPMNGLDRSSKENAREQGTILVTALLLLASVSVLTIGGVALTSTDTRISGNQKLAIQALYAAEGGSEYGVAQLRQLLRNKLNITTNDLNFAMPTLSGYTFETFTVQPSGNMQQQTITTGAFSGLQAFIQPYIITSEARLAGTNARAIITQQVEDNLIPLFQFGIFYEHDLEMLPGANMTFSGGRIHSNSDIYMATGATLSINAMTTSAGNIYHRRKDTSGTATNGTVRIKDGNDTYQTMTIDSTSPNWATQSQDIWDGRVKTQVQDIQKLQLPLPLGYPPIEVIKRGQSSDPPDLQQARFYSKAGLHVLVDENGNLTATNKNGSVIDLCYSDTSTPPKHICPITQKSTAFRDQREGKDIDITEVDISSLKLSPAAMAALNDPPTGGDPGILYVSAAGTSKGVRLINGGSLPTGGLTVASDNPIYIKGDYNTGNQPAAVAGDAVTILSNNWNDTNSTLNLSSRVASATTVSAAIMAGHVATQGANYSGGVENFPRFLENWSGVQFTYSGSLVSLWYSQQATARWQNTGIYYNAPTRNWSYGINTSNLPPGTPRVRTLQRVRWTQVAGG
jgi:PilX N-terminal